jgi:hypothetical protein
MSQHTPSQCYYPHDLVASINDTRENTKLTQTNSSNKSINNVVESSFQSLLDFGGVRGVVQGTMYKGSEEHEPTIIWDRKLGS